MLLRQGSNNKNAIHKRIDDLTDLWGEFNRNENPRLYRLMVDQENNDLIEAFISYHQEADSGLADLFLRFDIPFDTPGSYGVHLKSSLIELYQNEEFQELMITGGVTPNWPPPLSKHQDGDYANFAFCCKSFYDYHQNDLENFVAILTPSSIVDKVAWVNWLHNLLGMSFPASIRFIVLDNAHEPLLDELEVKNKEKVITHYPKINMVEIMEELAAQGNPNDPGVQFRQCFIGITKAAGDRNEKKLNELSQKALGIVNEKEWYPLKTTLFMTLAGAYYALENQAEALNNYKEARKAAALSEERGDKEGKQLVVHTAMAEASALIGLESFNEAAEIYDQNTIKVEGQSIGIDKANDLSMLLENYRMASYCYSLEKKYDMAWERGIKALDVGDEMEDTARQSSTLKYAGQILLELTERKAYREQKEWVHQRMVELLGDETWNQFLEELDQLNRKSKKGILGFLKN